MINANALLVCFMYGLLLPVGILAQGYFGSSAGIKLLWCQHRLAQGAALSRLFAACSPAMVWDQAGAKQLMCELQGMMGEWGGGSRLAGGTADKSSKPHTRLMARPSCTGRGMELYLWVLQLCSSLCVCEFFFATEKPRREARPPPRHKTPQPRRRHETADKGSDRGTSKGGSGRCPQKGARSEVSIAFCQG